jgi:hypothetical protein
MSGILFIVSNQVTCNKCGTTIWSTSRYDYKTCTCGAVGVDGGANYLKRSGNGYNYTEQSILVDAAISDKMNKFFTSIKPKSYNFIPSRFLWILFELGYTEALTAMHKEGEHQYLFERAEYKFEIDGALYGKMKDAAKSEFNAGKNAWGIALAMFRAIRDEGYIKALEKMITRIDNEDINFEEILAECYSQDKHSYRADLQHIVETYFRNRGIFIPFKQKQVIVGILVEIMSNKSSKEML